MSVSLDKFKTMALKLLVLSPSTERNDLLRELANLTIKDIDVSAASVIKALVDGDGITNFNTLLTKALGTPGIIADMSTSLATSNKENKKKIAVEKIAELNEIKRKAYANVEYIKLMKTNVDKAKEASNAARGDGDVNDAADAKVGELVTAIADVQTDTDTEYGKMTAAIAAASGLQAEYNLAVDSGTSTTRNAKLDAIVAEINNANNAAQQIKAKHEVVTDAIDVITAAAAAAAAAAPDAVAAKAAAVKAVEYLTAAGVTVQGLAGGMRRTMYGGMGEAEIENATAVLAEKERIKESGETWLEIISKGVAETAAAAAAASSFTSSSFGSTGTGTLGEAYEAFNKIHDPANYPKAFSTDDKCAASGFSKPTDPKDCMDVLEKIQNGSLSDKLQVLQTRGVEFGGNPHPDFVKVMAKFLNINKNDNFGVWEKQDKNKKDIDALKLTSTDVTVALKYVKELIDYIQKWKSQIYASKLSPEDRKKYTVANLTNWTRPVTSSSDSNTTVRTLKLKFNVSGGARTSCDSLMYNHMFGGGIVTNIIPMAGGTAKTKELEKKRDLAIAKLARAGMTIEENTLTKLNLLLQASHAMESKVQKFLIILDGFIRMKNALMNSSKNESKELGKTKGKKNVSLNDLTTHQDALQWVIDNIGEMEKCVGKGEHNCNYMYQKGEEAIKAILTASP